MGAWDMIFDSFYEHVEACKVCRILREQMKEKELCEEGQRLFDRIKAVFEGD